MPRTDGVQSKRSRSRWWRTATREEGDVRSTGPEASDAKLVLGFGDIWATSTPDRQVVRIDPGTRRVIARIRVGRDPRSVAAGGGLVWVAVEGSDRVVGIDPTTNRISRNFRVHAPSAILAVTKNSVWVGQLTDARVVRLDARTGRESKRFRVPGNPQPGMANGGWVWSPDHLHNDVLLIPVATGRLSRLEVGTHPSSLTLVGEHVWVTNYGDGTVSVVNAP